MAVFDINFSKPLGQFQTGTKRRLEFVNSRVQDKKQQPTNNPSKSQIGTDRKPILIPKSQVHTHRVCHCSSHVYLMLVLMLIIYFHIYSTFTLHDDNYWYFQGCLKHVNFGEILRHLPPLKKILATPLYKMYISY